MATIKGGMAKSNFKQENDREKRMAEAARLRDDYPDKIPVIVEKAERSDIPSIDSKKWQLLPPGMRVEKLVSLIRKSIKLSAEKAIFVFVDDDLLPTDATMAALYGEKKDEDGFLYVTYSGVNTPELLKVMDLVVNIPFLVASDGTRLDARIGWHVKKDENVLNLRIPLPGFGKEDVKVWVEGNMLVVEGEGGKESGDEEDDVRTSFYSRLDIPPQLYKKDSIKAEMKNGVLKMKIPRVKKEEQEGVFQVKIE